MLRLLHTADWHLGHTLHDLPREAEHQAFLDWLVEQLDDVDALLIAGDVFETANPSAAAQRQWYDFLVRARARAPRLDLVVVGGNHDSAARLDAPRALLDAVGVHVVGGLPRGPDGGLDLDRLVVPLHGADGAVAAWCAAVPFLRPADLPAGCTPGIQDQGDPLLAGVRRIYEQVLDAARPRLRRGQALVAMGHLYMVGGQLSELSERRILGGHQHALPATLFPADLAYVALGHLHRAQAVGGRPELRYCGSPLPLAVDEAPYPHQVRRVVLDGARRVLDEALPVPRSVEILRLPEGGPAPWDEVAPRLRALPAEDGDRLRWPYLEVRVRLDAPRPALRREVEEALAGRAARLVRLAVTRTGDARALADGEGRDLGELGPDEVFARKWARDHGTPPDPAVQACFHELLDAVQRGEGTPP